MHLSMSLSSLLDTLMLVLLGGPALLYKHTTVVLSLSQLY